MNKLFIVLLAVCLVSVNAFVKRDAPETVTEQNYLEKIQQGFQTFGTQVKSEMSKILDPEAINKAIKDFQNEAQNLANKFTEAPAKAA